jgi:myo-inositol-1(or 4)-monophosphatase
MRDTLIKALKSAGHIQRQRFGESLQMSLKESISSIVTDVDLSSEKAILETIRKEFPGHNLLGEESGFGNNNSDWTWVVDPLDGTSNFAAHLPWFGVLIAVFEKQIPVLAGAYLPIEDVLYVAERGKGTYRNGHRINMHPAVLSEALFAFSTDFTHDEAFLEKGMVWFKYIIKNSRNTRSTNSLVDLMYVLEGKFGGCINLFTKIWDIAAPWLLIREAGGLLTALDRNPMVFELSDKALYKNYPIIAGHELLVNSLLNNLPV